MLLDDGMALILSQFEDGKTHPIDRDNIGHAHNRHRRPLGLVSMRLGGEVETGLPVDDVASTPHC